MAENSGSENVCDTYSNQNLLWSIFSGMMVAKWLIFKNLYMQVCAPDVAEKWCLADVVLLHSVLWVVELNTMIEHSQIYLMVAKENILFQALFIQ